MKVKNSKAIIKNIEKPFIKQDIPELQVGDSVQIGVLIQEGNKERVQISEGVIISKKNSHLNSTITVRKILQNVGVEKIYLVHSPRITKIVVKKRAKVRKAKLYYLRNRLGKATRLKQKFN